MDESTTGVQLEAYFINADELSLRLLWKKTKRGRDSRRTLEIKLQRGRRKGPYLNPDKVLYYLKLVIFTAGFFRKRSHFAFDHFHSGLTIKKEQKQYIYHICNFGFAI